MPTWGEILKELADPVYQGDEARFDKVRRLYLGRLHQLTGRNVILYATRWLQGSPSAGFVSIVEEDVLGLMEVVHGLSGPNLDLILHSPGGSPSAAEALVLYLRSKFDHIRVVVPHMAMSAATMIACAADAVVMGKHSFLGPTDPQLLLPTREGGIRAVPAQAILEEFDQAIRECQDPKRIGAWIPKLEQFSPGLLVQCRNACALSTLLVEKWLAMYMFKGQPGSARRARLIGSWLADHREFKTHSRPIPRDALEAKGLRVEALEITQDIQDAFLSVFHATMHTFAGTSAVKIIENHQGRTFVKIVPNIFHQVPMIVPLPPPKSPTKFDPMPTGRYPGTQGQEAMPGDGEPARRARSEESGVEMKAARSSPL